MRLVLIFCMLLAMASIGQAQYAVQDLDLGKSSLKLALYSDWFQVQGSLQRFSGKLKLRSSDLTSAEVELSIDLSSISIDASQELGRVFQELFRSLSQPMGRFKSTRISRRKDDVYLVEGVFVRGASKHKISLPVRLVSLNRTKSVFQVLHQEQISGWDADLQLPVLPMNGLGKVAATLVFSAGRE